MDAQGRQFPQGALIQFRCIEPVDTRLSGKQSARFVIGGCVAGRLGRWDWRHCVRLARQFAEQLGHPAVNLFRQRLCIAQIFARIGHVILRVGAQMLDKAFARGVTGARRDLDHFRADPGHLSQAQIMHLIGAHIGGGKAAHAVIVIVFAARCRRNTGRSLAAIGRIFFCVEVVEITVRGQNPFFQSDARLIFQVLPIAVADRRWLIRCEGLPENRRLIIIDDLPLDPFFQPLHRFTGLSQPARHRLSAARNAPCIDLGKAL